MHILYSRTLLIFQFEVQYGTNGKKQETFEIKIVLGTVSIILSQLRGTKSAQACLQIRENFKNVQTTPPHTLTLAKA